MNGTIPYYIRKLLSAIW